VRTTFQYHCGLEEIAFVIASDAELFQPDQRANRALFSDTDWGTLFEILHNSGICDMFGAGTAFA
jgi:hypothetical protein